MPLYPSAEALIADAELRLDRFGADYGVMTVEGPDDKRFWCSRTYHRQQVITAGGRRLLLSARTLVNARKLDGVIFLTDCDYEVALGSLTPDSGLIVTKHADLEADLIAIGGLEEIIVQLVPATLNDDDMIKEVTSSVKQRAIALAEPLGRMRLVAKREAFPISTEIRHQKYRRDNTAEVDLPKLVRVVVQNSPDCPLTHEELFERVVSVPVNYNNCNGHDLVSAINHVLRVDFGVRDQTPESVASLLRNAIPTSRVAQLDMVGRIRRWEQQNERTVLSS
jgi:hypothetical protein